MRHDISMAVTTGWVIVNMCTAEQTQHHASWQGKVPNEHAPRCSSGASRSFNPTSSQQVVLFHHHVPLENLPALTNIPAIMPSWPSAHMHTLLIWLIPHHSQVSMRGSARGMVCGSVSAPHPQDQCVVQMVVSSRCVGSMFC